jgi:hypothetical protein
VDCSTGIANPSRPRIQHPRVVIDSHPPSQLYLRDKELQGGRQGGTIIPNIGQDRGFPLDSGNRLFFNPTEELDEFEEDLLQLGLDSHEDEAYVETHDPYLPNSFSPIHIEPASPQGLASPIFRQPTSQRVSREDQDNERVARHLLMATTPKPRLQGTQLDVPFNLGQNPPVGRLGGIPHKVVANLATSYPMATRIAPMVDINKTPVSTAEGPSQAAEQPPTAVQSASLRVQKIAARTMFSPLQSSGEKSSYNRFGIWGFGSSSVAKPSGGDAGSSIHLQPPPLDDFKILSSNVRGLNDPASVPTLKNYLDTIASLDVVYIQEHKLRDNAAASLDQRLWPQAQGWCMEASPGYANAQPGPGAGRGGIITLLAPKWALSVAESGAIQDNRGHWFILRGLPRGDLGVVNFMLQMSHHNGLDSRKN